MEELIEALVRGFFALLELIFEVFCFLVAGSVTLIAYLLSSGYRARKEGEWRGSTLTKVARLGYSGACLGALVAIPVWLALTEPESKPEPKLGRLVVEPPQKGEELRLSLSETNDAGKKEIRIAVKDGGLDKILSTRTMNELKSQIKENVARIDDETRDQNALRRQRFPLPEGDEG